MSKRLNLKCDFTRFFNDPTFPYKVTVCIGDERILCSGVLLAQRSSVLEQKFREDDGVLLFDEFLDVQNSHKSLQDCLQFLHGAKLTFSDDNVEVVLKFASLYKINDLFSATVQWIERSLRDTSGVAAVVAILKYLKMSHFLTSGDSQKVRKCVLSHVEKSGYDMKIDSVNGLKHDLIRPHLVGMSGQDVSELLKTEPFNSDFLVEWSSLSTTNKKFVLDHPALFNLDAIFRAENDFSKFMSILSEDESFMSKMYMGKLLKMQKDYLITKSNSAADKTPHVQDNLNQKQRNSVHNRVKAEHFKANPAQSKHENEVRASGSKGKRNIIIPEFTCLNLETNSRRKGPSQNLNSSSCGRKNTAVVNPYSYWGMLQSTLDFSSSVWVGNLPKSVNRNDLINVFSKHGAVVSITIRDAPSGDKKYAFVEFGHWKIAQNLIQHNKWNPIRLKGHYLKIAARQ